MNDLFILHLSDLHIDDKGLKLHESLLSDIKEQTISIPDKRLVVVVTGDVIDKGNPKAQDNAICFFDRLRQIVKNKLNAIYIVPGNHDKSRTSSNAFVVSAYRQLIHRQDQKPVFDETFKNNFWSIHKDSYEKSGYLNLVRYIYQSYSNLSEIEMIAEETYGVHVLSMNGKNYCFVLLNTAWSCADDSDTRQLILGDFQIKHISQKYIDATRGKKIDITFVLGHHPLDFLYGTEQDALFRRMISYNDLCANVYLCGHVHDRSVVNWSNNRHTIHSLVTGFGWPEQPSDRIHEHYYSIYAFHLNLNSMDIIVRRTADDSHFIDDLSIYTGENTMKKLTRPIDYKETPGTVELSSVKDVFPKTVFVTKAFLASGKQLFNSLNTVSIELGKQIGVYIDELFENLVPAKESEKECQTRVLFKYCMDDPGRYDILKPEQRELVEAIISSKDYKKRVFDNFQSYLQRLCLRLRQELEPDDNCAQNICCYFKYLVDKNSITYSTLCSSFTTSGPKNSDLSELPDTKYTGLLKAAFENSSSKCFIYSANEVICENVLNGNWKDYLVVAPNFRKNTFERKAFKNRRLYPLLAFCVIVNDNKYENLLRCMDFFSVDVFISDLLQLYLDTFMIETNEFLEWIKKEDKKGA